MACATCGNSILFGGKKSGSRKYCNKRCFDQDELGRMSDEVQDIEVDELAFKIRGSACPKCGENNNLEMFKSYFVYSIIVMTSWKEKPELSCRPCARKRQVGDLVKSLFLGWWGIPFGLIVTPIILIMNGAAMIINPLSKAPSKQLKEHSRLLIADKMLRDRENSLTRPEFKQ